MAFQHPLLQSAVELHQRGRIDEAEPLYRQVLALEPNNADALNLLGLALRQRGRFAEAVESLQRATQVDPSDAAYFANLGEAQRGLGQFPQAIESYRRAVQLCPQEFLVHYNLANLLRDAGQDAEAIPSYERSLKLNPQSTACHVALGQLLDKAGRLSEAADQLRRALLIEPNNLEAQIGLGAVLQRMGQLDEALACDRRALELSPAHPTAAFNLATALHLTNQYAEAIPYYRLALNEPAYRLEVLRSLGLALHIQGDRSAARDCFLRVLAENSEEADVRFLLGALNVSEGRFLEGWPDFEYRFRRPGRALRSLHRPRWSGMPAPGSAILLHADAGVGDALQFVRYAPVIAAHSGAKVWIEIVRGLIPLLRNSGFENLVAYGEQLPDFDFEVPMMSAPGAMRTTLEAIPAAIPYLKADRQRAAHWKERLAGVPGFRVGIHWQGSKNYVGDEHRSMPLAHFATLAAVPGVRLISLQKGVGTEQITELRGAFEVLTLDGLDEREGAFLDSAGVIENLDLVVTSDSAVAHLAGAMGAPTWLALSTHADWRWLLDRDDCPWYPTMRLWRQDRLDEWTSVFARMSAAIQQQIVADSLPI